MASSASGLDVRNDLILDNQIADKLSPYNHVLRMQPVKSFFFAWAVGILLTGLSFWMGVGHFHATVNIYTGARVATRQIGLGYFEQWNYGLWFVIPLLCPTVFFLCSFIFDATKRATPPSFCSDCDLNVVSKKHWVSIAGILIFALFVGKSIWVEVHDYDHLGLGWVQAEALEREAHLANTSGGPVPIPRRFRAFNINGEQVQADKVTLAGIEPSSFHVRNHHAFLVFIGVAKIWSGFWEGLVVYLSLLLSYWALGVYRAANTDQKSGPEKATGLLKFGIAWTQPVVISVLLLGIDVNLFSVLRFLANVFKGTFGSWDQYWSLLVLTPTLVLLILAIAVVIKALRSGYIDPDNAVSRLEITLWSIWITSYGLLCHLLLGFNDGPTNNVLASIVQFVTKQKG